MQSNLNRTHCYARPSDSLQLQWGGFHCFWSFLQLWSLGWYHYIGNIQSDNSFIQATYEETRTVVDSAGTKFKCTYKLSYNNAAKFSKAKCSATCTPKKSGKTVTETFNIEKIGKSVTVKHTIKKGKKAVTSIVVEDCKSIFFLKMKSVVKYLQMLLQQQPQPQPQPQPWMSPMTAPAGCPQTVKEISWLLSGPLFQLWSIGSCLVVEVFWEI